MQPEAQTDAPYPAPAVWADPDTPENSPLVHEIVSATDPLTDPPANIDRSRLRTRCGRHEPEAKQIRFYCSVYRPNCAECAAAPVRPKRPGENHAWIQFTLSGLRPQTPRA